jgi:type III secretion protein O
MTVLDELLRLKRYREDKAEMLLARRRLELADMRRRAEESQEALDHYRRWSVEHERELYGALYGHTVRPKVLENLRDDVVMLRVKERSLMDEAKRLDADVGQADAAFRDSRAAHQQASRVREKFVQLVLAQSEELRVEAERKEDGELEELYGAPRERDEWEEAVDE